MVTSRSRTALFLQFGGAVIARDGVTVTAGVGVAVSGTNPGFVGRNVAVTKFC